MYFGVFYLTTLTTGENFVHRSPASGSAYEGRPVYSMYVKNLNIVGENVYYHDQTAVRSTTIMGCSIGETSANNFGLGVFNLPSCTVNGNVQYDTGTQNYFVH